MSMSSSPSVSHESLPPAAKYSSLKVALALIRKYPMIVILPVALLCVCIPLGTWAILKAADSQVRHTRDAMQNLAVALSLNLNEQVQPAITLATGVAVLLAKGNTSAAYDSALLTDLVSDLVDEINSTGLICSLFGLPNGRFASIYKQPPELRFLIGEDILAGTSRNFILRILKDAQYTTVRSGLARPKNMDITKPPLQLLTSVSMPANGPPSDAQRTEMYGNSTTEARCPEGICYNLTTNRHWWGSVMININVQVVAAALRQQAEVGGGRFTITAPPDFLGPAYVVAATNRRAPVDASSVSQPVGVPSDGWRLYVAPKEGWTVLWEIPAIVVLVVGSLALAACVMAMALYRAHYLSLLESLLPRKALKQIMHEAKKQGRVELGISVPGTTAELILKLTRTLLESPVDGIDVRDVIAIQSVVHSTANIYTPMWQDNAALVNLDADVIQSLQMALGAHGPTDAAEAPTGGDLFLRGVRGDVTLEDGGGEGDDAAVQFEASAFDTLEAALAMITQHTFGGGGGGATASASIAHRATFDGLDGGGDARDGRLANHSGSLITALASQRSPSSFSLRGLISGGDGTSRSGSYVIVANVGVGGGGSGSGGGSFINTQHMIMASMALPAVAKSQRRSSLSVQVSAIQLEAVLATAEGFAFDAFSLHAASNGHPLSSLAYYCLATSGLIQRLGINKAVLCKWLLRIEAGYDASNPYHNATHAADVLQTYHALLTRGGLAPLYVHTDLWLLACYMAAIIHDVGHVGWTNDFLINTGHDLAIVFNDKAPLENMHMSNAWMVLTHPDYNFLAHLSKAELMQLRRTIIDLVLATDMKQHFALLGQFNAMNGVGPDVVAADKARIVQADDGVLEAEPLRPPVLRPLVKRSAQATDRSEGSGHHAGLNDAERLLALQVALKCADLGHTTADLAVHQRWVSALEEEFFRQGDVEKTRSLPISPLFDRAKQGVSKSQIGFYEMVVLPLYSSFSFVFPNADPLTAGALLNFRYWKLHSAQAGGAAATAAAASAARNS